MIILHLPGFDQESTNSKLMQKLSKVGQNNQKKSSFNKLSRQQMNQWQKKEVQQSESGFG